LTALLREALKSPLVRARVTTSWIAPEKKGLLGKWSAIRTLEQRVPIGLFQEL
jgi:hypothetical protein